MSTRMLNGRYETYEAVGVGNYGRVYEGFDTVGKCKVAIKELFPEVVRSEELMKITFMEIEVLGNIRHPYIIRLIDHFRLGESYCLVYEYCDKGDLKVYVDKHAKLSEQEALKFVFQMAEALCELKRIMIIHRDIKPENIFLTGDVCKLGDFGLCFHGDRVQLNASVGSLGFLAPETQMQLVYSSKADVYSLGICFYEMMHGDIPFNQDQINDLYNIKMNLKINPPPDVRISELGLNLMRRMVDPNEATRIDCVQVRDILAPLYPQYAFKGQQPSPGQYQLPRSQVGVNQPPSRSASVHKSFAGPGKRESRLNPLYRWEAEQPDGNSARFSSASSKRREHAVPKSATKLSFS